MKSITKYFIAFLYLLSFSTFLPAHSVLGQENIRVSILKGQENIRISGGEIAIIDYITGNKIASGSNSSVFIEEGDNGLNVNKIPIPFSHISISNHNGMLEVNGKGFRGKIEVLKENDNSLLVINELNLEDYLIGLINQEMSSEWNMEALKAQAVAARTYALFQKANRKESLYCLESTVLDQVYNGSDSEDSRSRQAVQNTEGEVIIDQGEIIPAVYHSCCGGKTEPARLVWQNSSPLLQTVICRFCGDYPRYFWELKLTYEEVKKKLNAEGYQIENIKEVNIANRSETNRVIELSIKGRRNNIIITGNEMRRILGFDRLRSTNFIVKNLRGSVRFLGIGYGHGAGLCQWGAKKMADNGYTYREILHYYYPFGDIKKIY